MLSIRTSQPADAESIAEFNRRMAKETEGLELDPGRLAEGVRGLFSHPQYGFYLVAESGGRIVGQLMVTYEWSDWRNGVIWWIQSVYVAPEARGQGVYRALYQDLQRRAEAAGNVRGIRLYVEKHNARAQAVYTKLGMQRAPYDVFEVDFVIAR